MQQIKLSLFPNIVMYKISYNINNLKTKRGPLYLKTQFVPRSKYFHLGYKN